MVFFSFLRQDPLEFLVTLTFLCHGVEEIGGGGGGASCVRTTEKIQRKSWGNVPPSLLVCIGFLYKVVHKTGRL